MSKNINWSDTILEKTIVGSNMYFVHSFVLFLKMIQIFYPQQTIEMLNLFNDERGNIYGCQFHPEKVRMKVYQLFKILLTSA